MRHHLLTSGAPLALLVGLLPAQETIHAELEARLVPPVSSASFGFGADLDGWRAAIGVAGSINAGLPSEVQVWERDTSGWNLADRLDLPGGPLPTGYARAVALDGDTLAVSGPEMALVYRFDGVDWNLMAQLQPPAGSAFISSFARGLALDDDTLAVTATQYVAMKTHVFVFREVAGVWSLEQEVVGQSNGPGKIALDGDTLVFAAFPATHFFVRDQGVWSRQASIEVESGWQGGDLGWSVALDGDVALVGAPTGQPYEHDPPAHGVVHVFERSGAIWSRTALLTPPGPMPGSGLHNRFFGGGVAVEGDRCVVAASGLPCCPRAYAYEREGGIWQRRALLLDPSSASGDGFGLTGVALDGGRVLLGSPFASSGPQSSGAATFFRLTDGIGLVFCTGTQCPCANDAEAGCSNSTSAGAQLAGLGSNQVGADDLSLVASALPPGSVGILAAGTAPTNATFGDGLRCVARSVLRFPPRQADASGAFTEGPGIAGTLGVLPGETRLFQAWYRDPAGPCGGGFNATNAYEVGFVP